MFNKKLLLYQVTQLIKYSYYKRKAFAYQNPRGYDKLHIEADI